MKYHKTFRLFISSTFNDLKEERNILQQEVFPEIKSFCQLHGYGFEPIDLRWGVSNEASLDHQAMKICIHEVEKISHYPKPNFLIMLGNRYGWIPIPSEIEKTHYDQLFEYATLEEKKLLKKWYKRDNNSFPIHYILQPINLILKSGKEKIWYDKEENKLRVLITKHQHIFPKNLHIGKSATEQEIIKGVLESAEKLRHTNNSVLCMVRNILNIKDIKDSIFTNDYSVELQNLKNTLKNCKTPLVQYTELEARIIKKEDVLKPNKEYLEDYAIEVKKFLKEKIHNEIKRLKKNSLRLEHQLHETFKVDRARNFIGRQDLFYIAHQYLTDKTNAPLVFYGESGVGKSAFLAKIIASFEKIDNQNIHLIYRFVGISEKSSQPKSLIDDITHSIHSLLEYPVLSESKDYSESISRFAEALHQFSNHSTKKLILVIDALDQFETKNNLEWIEPTLAHNIKLIVSTLPSPYGEYFDILSSKIKSENIHELKKLEASDASLILQSWLDENNRKLTSHQHQHILDLFEKNGLPLYLKIIFDQALSWKSYDTHYRSLVPNTLTEAIHTYFKSLIADRHHAKTLVEHTLGYLSASKNGLSESELVEVLSSDMSVLQDISNPYHTIPSIPGADKLPSAVWSRLYYDILKYITFIEFHGYSLLSFYHRKIKECVKDYYYMPNQMLYHSNLLEYFWNQPLSYSKSKKTNLRKLSELPYHCIQSHAYSKFLILYTIEFIDLKTRHNQRNEMLLECYEICKNIHNNTAMTDTYKNFFLESLAKQILAYLIEHIKNPSHTLFGIEDIHAILIYRDDMSFYKHILSLGCNLEKLLEFHPTIDIRIIKQYVAAFSARKANMIRRSAHLDEAAHLYDTLESQGFVSLLDFSEQSRIYYDIGYIAYLSGDFDKAIAFMEKSEGFAQKDQNYVSQYISKCVGDHIKMLWRNEDRLFEATLIKALSIFEDHKFKNFGAKRWIRNVYAHLFEVGYIQKDHSKCEKYLSLLKSDDWIIESHLSNYSSLTPYEARIHLLNHRYKEAAKLFEGYIYEYIPEEKRHIQESFAREYYDYLVALQQIDLVRFQAKYHEALKLPDEPGNHIWKDKISRL